jgi:hypothetical protein
LVNPKAIKIMKRVVTNELGEPLYIENVRDQYEEEIAYCEEMDLLANDPYYAARKEDRKWYDTACAIFEERGISVPQDVIESLSRELRKKEAERQEKEAIAEVQPIIDFLNEKLPNCGAYARYNPETPMEVAYVEVDFENTPYRWEVENLLPEAMEKELYIEDYISFSFLKTKVSKHIDGGFYGKNVSDWTAEEYCGQDMLFVVKKDCNEDYLWGIKEIRPNGDGDRDYLKKKYPSEDYLIWSGEIRHREGKGDIICFHWS